jgi:hypothetical protein
VLIAAIAELFFLAPGAAGPESSGAGGSATLATARETIPV